MTPATPSRERGALSDRELYLARSALGLQFRDVKRSYRNRYFIFDGSDDFDVWRGMVDRGLAEGDIQTHPKLSEFWLTRAGAEAALEKGESLCREDFPPTPPATIKEPSR